MTRLMLLTALILTSAGPAAAQRSIDYTEGAYELQLRQVELPTGPGGTLRFKPCADCTRVALQVSSATRYSLVNGGPLPLPDFLVLAAQIRQAEAGNDGTRVGVFYDLESKRVTRVILVPVF